jgi:beta-mannosidase
METRWVGRTNWTFSRDFTVSADLLEKSKIVLVCNGLDTIADVFINEILVGSSRNMFVRYIYDIKSAVKVKEPLKDRFKMI